MLQAYTVINIINISINFSIIMTSHVSSVCIAISDTGFRRPGGQYKWYKDCLKTTMTQCRITLRTWNTRDGQNWLVFHMQVSCRRVWSTTHSGVGGQTGSAQVWSTIRQQLRVPDLPPDVSFTDWASCPQQVSLVMMRPVVSTHQSMGVTLKTWT